MRDAGFRRSALMVLAAALALGVVLAGALILVWKLINGPGAGARDSLFPPTGPVAARSVLAVIRIDVLRAAGPAWAPAEERDEPCMDSTPASMELDLRSRTAEVDGLISALESRGWTPHGTSLRRRMNRAVVDLTVTDAGDHVTVYASADNGSGDGYCQQPEAPPTTFVPTPEHS